MKITEDRIREAIKMIDKMTTEEWDDNTESMSGREMIYFHNELCSKDRVLKLILSETPNFGGDVDYELARDIQKIIDSFNSHKCYGVPLNKIAYVYWVMYMLYHVCRCARNYFKESYNQSVFDKLCNEIADIVI